MSLSKRLFFPDEYALLDELSKDIKVSLDLKINGELIKENGND